MMTFDKCNCALQKQTDKLFQVLDKDKNGEISMKELEQWFG